MSMFCYQCEQTAQGTGCNTMGICGKDPDTAALQDLIVNIVKGISCYADAARSLGESNSEVDDVTLEALFMTLTNVNFDEKEHVVYMKKLSEIRDKARWIYLDAAKQRGQQPISFTGPAVMQIPQTEKELLEVAGTVSILLEIARDGADVAGLKEMLIYGIKGLAAYAHHAAKFGYRDDSVFAFVHRALATLTRSGVTADELLQLCLETGKVNFDVIAMLDRAHTEVLGQPVPTQAKTSHVACASGSPRRGNLCRGVVC